MNKPRTPKLSKTLIKEVSTILNTEGYFVNVPASQSCVLAIASNPDHDIKTYVRRALWASKFSLNVALCPDHRTVMITEVTAE